jgi:hypothetical protein
MGSSFDAGRVLLTSNTLAARASWVLDTDNSGTINSLSSGGTATAMSTKMKPGEWTVTNGHGLARLTLTRLG